MIYSSLEEIAKANIPVLLPDTCILLDLIRSPRRESVDGNSILSGRAIQEAIHTSGEVGCIITQQVREELIANLPGVRKDTSKNLTKLSEEIQRIDEWSKALNHESRTDVSHFLGRIPVAESIIGDIVSSSLNFTTTYTITGRAFARVTKDITPSAKGKDSIKDCVVVESYLEISRRLTDLGHKAVIVFASSNTKEFCSVEQGKLNKDIAVEFNSHRIVYARALGEVRHQLNLTLP